MTRADRSAWEGHFRAYSDRDGMRIPIDGEVGWHIAGAWHKIWEGRLQNVKYAFHEENRVPPPK